MIEIDPKFITMDTEKGNWWDVKEFNRDDSPVYNYCNCQSINVDDRLPYHETVTLDNETCAICGVYLYKSSDVYETYKLPTLEELEENIDTLKVHQITAKEVILEYNKNIALEALSGISKASEQLVYKVCRVCKKNLLESKFQGLGRVCMLCYNLKRKNNRKELNKKKVKREYMKSYMKKYRENKQ